MSKQIKVIFHGFGRIGRSIFRQICTDKKFVIIGINEINPDPKNISYTYNFDSIVRSNLKKYGQIKFENKKFKLKNKSFNYYNFSRVEELKKIPHKYDVIIDSTGTSNNGSLWKKLIKLKKNIKIIFTFHHPVSEYLMVIGANEKKYNKKFRLISSSICDVVAIAPYLKLLDEKFKIVSGHITTVHPILSYQNLLSNKSISWSSPGNTYSHYSLGRSALNNLIPKPTSILATMKPSIDTFNVSKLKCFSYRVPTQIVGSSDINLVFQKDFSIDKINRTIYTEIKKQKYKIFSTNDEPKVSIDYLNDKHSLIYDKPWSSKSGKLFHSVIWYDNENGYSARVLDNLKIIFK